MRPHMERKASPRRNDDKALLFLLCGMKVRNLFPTHSCSIHGTVHRRRMNP